MCNDTRFTVDERTLFKTKFPFIKINGKKKIKQNFFLDLHINYPAQRIPMKETNRSEVRRSFMDVLERLRLLCRHFERRRALRRIIKCANLKKNSVKNSISVY